MTGRDLIATHMSKRRKIRLKLYYRLCRQQISRNYPAKQETVTTENKWVIEIKELKKFMAEKK